MRRALTEAWPRAKTLHTSVTPGSKLLEASCSGCRPRSLEPGLGLDPCYMTYWVNFHFRNQEAKAQAGEATCPNPHTQDVLRFELTPSSSLGLFTLCHNPPCSPLTLAYTRASVHTPLGFEHTETTCC